MTREDSYARALQLYQSGDRAGAERVCLEILDRQPLRAEALYLLGVVALDHDQVARAVRHFHHATTLQPDNADYHHALGEAFRTWKDPARAVLCLREALRLDPNRVASYNALGMALMDQDEVDVAVAIFRQALALNPAYERAHLNLGRALQLVGELDEAVSCYTEAIRLRPDYAIAHNNLGAVLQTQDRHAEAANHLRRALQLQPHYPEAHYNLGNALRGLDDLAAACASYREAIRLRPEYVAAHLQLGIALENLGRRDEALVCFQSLLRFDPEHGEAYYRLALLLLVTRQWDAARAALEKATALLPDPGEALSELVHAKQMLCDWSTLPADLDRLWARASSRLNEGKPSGLPPWFAVIGPWPAERLLAVARGQARAINACQEKLRQTLDFRHPRTRSRRLHIGYVSGDFCNHATSHLMQTMFGLHDRAEFEVSAYSFGPDDGSSYRRRIAADCEHFVDVAALSPADLARRIADDGVHILVDLMGYCGFSRLEVFALRPAPIQVSYLVYPGTTGADFIDYLLADRIVAPPEATAHFTEKLVWLPHSYQVNDREQPIAATPNRRTPHGLPEKGFVYCSLNNGYKFEPLIFGVWMNVLKSVPGSVLWLLSAGATMEANLRREAAARGVAPDRLVFAPTLSKPEHLARLRLADLFLDTHLVNAHTTASDALWAGVPLLTCPGGKFAARVAASLLTAVGLPELIAPDLPAYERLAVRLARQPEELRRLRDKLAAQRTTWPLFDTPRFVRNLERAFREMWDVWAAGEAPRSIEVVEDPV
jgi:protein O-GlcNAc transferase